IKLRRTRYTGQHRVATIAASVDSDTIAVCDTLVDQPLHAVGDIVLHGKAPLTEALFPEAAPIAGRAAEIHLQHAITAIGNKLCLRVEAPPVAGPGPAMRVDHAGNLMRLTTFGQGQIPVYDQAITRRVLNGSNLGHMLFGQCR